MASLSEQMKNKRDVRRRSTILILDKDLGNYGLYKSILAMEYELDCANSINLAMNLCRSKYYDVIIADGGFSPDIVGAFYDEVAGLHKGDKPILLVLEEASNKESVISYLCEGANDYIPKPFTKDGITNIIYEQLKKRREHDVRQNVLIVDKDFKLLTDMKGYLSQLYDVNIINSCEVTKCYLTLHRPDLIICDYSMIKDQVDTFCELRGTDKGNGIPLMFMTDTPDTETISACARFEPEGFLVKPIESEMLMKTLERIFLMESYTSFNR